MVCNVEQTHLEAPKLAVRSDLDDLVRTDGYCRVEGVEHRFIGITDNGFVDLRCTIGTEFLLVADFLFATSTRTGLFGGYMPCGNASAVHFGDTKIQAGSGVAFCPLPGLGEFCSVVELHHLENESSLANC